MIYIVHNALPILLATLAGLVFGLGYDRLVRGGAATRLPSQIALITIVAELWFCAILAGALILAPPGKADAWTMALGSAVVIWIGFVMPALIVTLRYRTQTWRAALLDSGHWLGLMLVQAAVLHLIGVTAPHG